MSEQAQTIQIEDAISQRTVSDVRISPDGTLAVFSLGWASKTEEHPQADLWVAATDGSGGLHRRRDRG